MSMHSCPSTLGGLLPPCRLYDHRIKLSTVVMWDDFYVMSGGTLKGEPEWAKYKALWGTTVQHE